MEYPGYYNDAPACCLPDAHHPNNEVPITPHLAECQLAMESGINPVGSYDDEMATDKPLYSSPAWPANHGLTPPFGQPLNYGFTQPHIIQPTSYSYETLSYPTPLLDIGMQPNANASPPPPIPGWLESNHVDQPIRSFYDRPFDRKEYEKLQSTSLTHLEHAAANLLPQASSPTTEFECGYKTCSKTFKRIARAEACYNGHLQQKPYVCDGACGDEDCESTFSSAQNRSRHCRGSDERKAPCPRW